MPLANKGPHHLHTVLGVLWFLKHLSIELQNRIAADQDVPLLFSLGEAVDQLIDLATTSRNVVLPGAWEIGFVQILREGARNSFVLQPLRKVRDTWVCSS